MYVPISKLLALAFRLAMVVAAGPPGLKLPLADETLSQSEVLMTDQFNDDAP